MVLKHLAAHTRDITVNSEIIAGRPTTLTKLMGLTRRQHGLTNCSQVQIRVLLIPKHAFKAQLTPGALPLRLTVISRVPTVKMQSKALPGATQNRLNVGHRPQECQPSLAVEVMSGQQTASILTSNSRSPTKLC